VTWLSAPGSRGVMMAKWNVGTKNGFWKGGRLVASNGYVLIRMPGHHLADVRGYVYEHRLIAELVLGRRLKTGEIPHHKNGIKTDNRPENIEVVESAAHHRVHHRKPGGKALRLPDEPNPNVACACGCGLMFQKYDVAGRPRLFVAGHNPQPAETREAILKALSAGPLHRDRLAAAISRTLQATAVALSKLRGAGLVRPDGAGIWRVI